MLIELRKKSQITIPKKMMNELGLNEGDFFDVRLENGNIILEPVEIIKKITSKSIKNETLKKNEVDTDYQTGSFNSVDEVLKFLDDVSEK